MDFGEWSRAAYEISNRNENTTTVRVASARLAHLTLFSIRKKVPA